MFSLIGLKEDHIQEDFSDGFKGPPRYQNGFRGVLFV